VSKWFKKLNVPRSLSKIGETNLKNKIKLEKFSKKLESLDKIEQEKIESKHIKYSVKIANDTKIGHGQSVKIIVQSDGFKVQQGFSWWFEGFTKKWPELCVHSGIIHRDKSIEVTNFGEENIHLKSGSVVGETWLTKSILYDDLDFDDPVINTMEIENGKPNFVEQTINNKTITIPFNMKTIINKNKEIFRTEEPSEAFKFINV